MRVRIKNDYTLTAFNNLIDAVLLSDSNEVQIIRKVEYETVTETPPEKKARKGYYIRKKDKGETTPKERTYITKLVLEGYNADLKFVGTYNDGYCERFIGLQDEDHSGFNVVESRKRWVKLRKQLEEMGIQVILPQDEKEMITTHTDDGSVKCEEAKPQPKRIENRKLV